MLPRTTADQSPLNPAANHSQDQSNVTPLSCIYDQERAEQQILYVSSGPNGHSPCLYTISGPDQYGRIHRINRDHPPQPSDITKDDTGAIQHSQWQSTFAIGRHSYSIFFQISDGVPSLDYYTVYYQDNATLALTHNSPSGDIYYLYVSSLVQNHSDNPSAYTRAPYLYTIDAQTGQSQIVGHNPTYSPNDYTWLSSVKLGNDDFIVRFSFNEHGQPSIYPITESPKAGAHDTSTPIEGDTAKADTPGGIAKSSEAKEIQATTTEETKQDNTKKLATAWGKWKAQTKEDQEAAATNANRAANHFTRHLTSTALSQWKAQTNLAKRTTEKKLQNATQHYNNQLLRPHFEHWKTQSTCNQFLQTTISSIEQEQQLLRSHFERWSNSTLAARSYKRKVENADHHANQKLQLKTFAALRATTVASLYAENAAKQMRKKQKELRKEQLKKNCTAAIQKIIIKKREGTEAQKLQAQLQELSTLKDQEKIQRGKNIISLEIAKIDKKLEQQLTKDSAAMNTDTGARTTTRQKHLRATPNSVLKKKKRFNWTKAISHPTLLVTLFIPAVFIAAEPTVKNQDKLKYITSLFLMGASLGAGWIKYFCPNTCSDTIMIKSDVHRNTIQQSPCDKACTFWNDIKVQLLECVQNAWPENPSNPK